MTTAHLRPARGAHRELTRYTTLVWTLVWVPLVVGAAALVTVGATVLYHQVKISLHQWSYDSVSAAYTETGYLPPRHTTLTTQSADVCANLAGGMNRDQAVDAFATSWNTSQTVAEAVVDANIENTCHAS
ncbi:MAG TPA: hypothetical protein VFE65_06185 [Pseudonocardia sp.]|jgi:hypothetical protein|nr:hypothetical protein [Pseudonocardia sp.]